MNFKKNFKKITALAAVMAMALSMAACGADNAADNTDTAAESTSAAENAAETAEILNFIPPEKGEKIAVMTVKDYGEIKIKLFPEAASKGVENFIGLADMNYYDELIFHRVIPHFMDQGGDPQGTGMGGQSCGAEALTAVSPKDFTISAELSHMQTQAPPPPTEASSIS